MSQALHLIDSLTLGGAQRVLKTYFESDQNNQSLHLFSLRDVDTPVIIDHQNVTVVKSRGKYSLKPLLDVFKLVKSEEIAYVHCHLFRAQIFGLLVKIGVRRRFRLIFHEHGRVVGREYESNLERVAFRIFISISHRWVDQYICNSKLTKDCLTPLISSKSSVAIVHNPIVKAKEISQNERARMREKMGVPKDAFVVGFAGRLIRTKGWHHFLEAVNTVTETSEIFFIIAGIGPDTIDVKRVVNRLGLDGRGQIMGHVHDMSHYFSLIDCFVMPSLWESHGMTHLEAQAAEVPIIVSNIPGLNATVRPGIDAMVCPPGDSLAIAQMIVRLKENTDLRNTLVENGLVNFGRFSLAGYKKCIHHLERGYHKEHAFLESG